MGLQAAIEAVQDVMIGLTGIRKAPDEPPDAINVYPFALAFAGSGEWEMEAGWKKGIHVITLQVHVARKDLPRDIKKAMAYSELVPNALFDDPTLAGTVDTIISPITYTFGALGWGGVETLGFDWKIRVKIQDAIT